MANLWSWAHRLRLDINDNIVITQNTSYRGKKIIFGDNEAIIEDTEKNIIKLKEKYKILIDEEIIKSINIIK